MKRTDAHSKANLKPESYEVLQYIYTKCPVLFSGDAASIEYHKEAMECFRADMDRVNKMLQERGAEIHGGWSHCDHCGAYYHHGVLLEHRETKELITVGWICADSNFSLDNIAYQRKFIETVQKAVRARRSRFAKLRQFVEANPDVRLLPRDGGKFLASLREQLIARGSLSPLQVSCIAASVEREIKWAREKADRQEAEDAEPKVPAPEGRVTVEGVVVHTKVQDSDFGAVLKMLLKCDGFKVWATIPDSIAVIEVVNKDGFTDQVSVKGHRIRVRLTLTRSPKDDSFAFGKRPTNAEVLD